MKVECLQLSVTITDRLRPPVIVVMVGLPPVIELVLCKRGIVVVVVVFVVVVGVAVALVVVIVFVVRLHTRSRWW